MPMQIQLIPVTPNQQNCSVVVCNASYKAAVVDPGGEAESILGVVEKMKPGPDRAYTYLLALNAISLML